MSRREAAAPIVVLQPQELRSPEREGPVQVVDAARSLARVVGGGAWVLIRADQLALGLPALPEPSASLDAGISDESSASGAGARPNFVLVNVEARERGFKSPLAFRRWCRRHGVLIRREEGGRLMWVDRQDVDRAVQGLPARHGGEVHAEAGRSVADFIARQRR